MKKLAIIGVGNWGKNLIREYSRISDVLFFSNLSNEDDRDWIHESYPQIAFASINSILENDSLDAVVIATPIDTHFDLCKKALLSGKHVFIEKPITDSYLKAKELEKIVLKTRLVLFVGHIFLYHEVFDKINSLGENIDYIEFSWNKFGTFKEDIYYNLVIHALSITNTLLGCPQGFKTRFSNADRVDLELMYKNARALVKIDRRCHEKRFRVFVHTESNSYLWIDDRLLVLDDETYKPLFKAFRSSLEHECGEFIDMIDNYSKARDRLRSAIGFVRAMEEIRK